MLLLTLWPTFRCSGAAAVFLSTLPTKSGAGSQWSLVCPLSAATSTDEWGLATPLGDATRSPTHRSVGRGKKGGRKEGYGEVGMWGTEAVEHGLGKSFKCNNVQAAGRQLGRMWRWAKKSMLCETSQGNWGKGEVGTEQNSVLVLWEGWRGKVEKCHVLTLWFKRWLVLQSRGSADFLRADSVESHGLRAHDLCRKFFTFFMIKPFRTCFSFFTFPQQMSQSAF